MSLRTNLHTGLYTAASADLLLGVMVQCDLSVPRKIYPKTSRESCKDVKIPVSGGGEFSVLYKEKTAELSFGGFLGLSGPATGEVAEPAEVQR